MARLNVSTPWGPAQTHQHFAEGIDFYSTASHGGFKLSEERLAKIPAEWARYAARWAGSPGWFEEDCAWAAVAITFSEAFPQRDWELAVKIGSQYLPRVA